MKNTIKITTTIQTTINIDEVEKLWTELETRTEPSFFLSWGWIGNWLSTIPETTKPLLLLVAHHDLVVGLAILIKKKCFRKMLIMPSRSFYMHQTGIPEFDTLTIEYNGMLIDDAYQKEVTNAIYMFFKHNVPEWDEIFINGIEENNPLVNNEVIKNNNLLLKINAELPSWYVDLKEIRNGSKGYIDYLSQNTRYQIRRSLRECKKYGDLEIKRANTIKEAKEYFNELVLYHQKYWLKKGKAGSFANKYFLEFHEKLIKERFYSDEIHIFKISINDNPLGYIYNLNNNGHVSYYQSGFNYKFNKKIKPGIISHYMAIEYYKNNIYDEYDFLASSDRYKKSMSTKNRKLLWVSVQQPRNKFLIEESIRKLYNRSGLRNLYMMINQ